MVAWGGSSLQFLGDLGSSFLDLYAAPLQPPRWETTYRPRNDPLEAKEVKWVGLLRWEQGVGRW